jgi:hypothetical protein
VLAALPSILVVDICHSGSGRPPSDGLFLGFDFNFNLS